MTRYFLQRKSKVTGTKLTVDITGRYLGQSGRKGKVFENRREKSRQIIAETKWKNNFRK
jgi:hypothetical protein